MHALPTRTKVMLLQLLWLQVLMQLAASDMVVSLREHLLRKEGAYITMQPLSGEAVDVWWKNRWWAETTGRDSIQV